jgi:hypothetical protein
LAPRIQKHRKQDSPRRRRRSAPPIDAEREREIDALSNQIARSWGGRPFASRPDSERVLDLKPRALENLAIAGAGPPYSIVARKARYAARDLARWVISRQRRSTSDQGGNHCAS